MDCNPDIFDVIKQEDQDVEFCFDVHVKVENDIGEWPMRPASNETYQQDRIFFEKIEQNYSKDRPRYFLSPKEDYHDEIAYASNENYQNNISHEEAKQDWSVISDCFIQHEKNKDIIPYEELKEDSFQTCMLCGIYFSNSYSLLQHNLIHLKVPLIKQKLFICEHCPKYCKKKKDLKNHMLINHIKKYNPQIPITKQRHECLICNKTYSYKHWFSHMKDVHSEAEFKCKKCNLSFKCKRYLKKHNIHVHEGVKKKIKIKKYMLKETKCPQCPAILNCKYALTTHLRNCHSKETHTCHICNSTLKCKSYLLAHLKRVHHNDGILHQCDICGKEFKSGRYVKIHIKNSHIKKES